MINYSWIIKYNVIGFDSIQIAGPYNTIDEAMYQFNDIQGYEGVYNCYLERVNDGQ
jgi:hypothetical protein